MSSDHEYDFEMIAGLPGVLPKGERLLWQGKPEWFSFLNHALHAKWVAAYFAALMVWRYVAEISDGRGVYAAFVSALWLALLGAIVMAILAAFAWATARTTIYSITSKRVVYRFGIALQMAVNVPFNQIDGAGLKTFSDGTGEVTLAIGGTDRLAYLVLWPHARRWRYLSPEPMFRSVADATGVAKILTGALAASSRADATPAPITASQPSRPLKPIAAAVAA